MISSSRIPVTDTATALNAPSTAGQRLRLKNDGDNAIDLGNSNVADGAGYELLAGAVTEVKIAPGDQLFGISAAEQSNDVHVLVT